MPPKQRATALQASSNTTARATRDQSERSPQRRATSGPTHPGSRDSGRGASKGRAASMGAVRPARQQQPQQSQQSGSGGTVDRQVYLGSKRRVPYSKSQLDELSPTEKNRILKNRAAAAKSKDRQRQEVQRMVNKLEEQTQEHDGLLAEKERLQKAAEAAVQDLIQRQQDCNCNNCKKALRRTSR